MKFTRIIPRMACVLLAVCLLLSAMASCSKKDAVPDGYQYATCRGEYFRLYVPTQWTVNTESGVSGAYISMGEETAVSMVEVPFEKALETTAEGETVAPTAATLADFVDAHMAEISAMKNFRLISSSDKFQINRYPAYDMTYFATIGEKDYRYRQVLCSVGVEGAARFYIFTYSSGDASFDQWKEVVDGILAEIIFSAVPFEGSDDDRRIPNVDDVPAGMKLVSTNENAYRFYAPADWIAEPGSAASLVYASETDRSNVSVIGYVPNVEPYGVADYWKATEAAYKDTLSDFTVVSITENEKMGERLTTVYEYTYSIGGVTYHSRQAVCAYSYMIVSMTYTALAENYEAHLADAQAMQAALTFRKPIVG